FQSGPRSPFLPRFHSTTNEAQFVVRMSASEIRGARVSPERVLKGVHACGGNFCFVVISFTEGTLRRSCPESGNPALGPGFRWSLPSRKRGGNERSFAVRSAWS